ncbi:uncharacterized protein LOC120155967 [Hibiscus syriacus]|uniref:uncharacterized protein LOC120155967 n=1 Tax=Hibiscus syriacus TaxID=106335 RepID=UPI0019239F6D|nr:uncharacterized protein LOC120155967 [Hibiscus syriacus]
MRGINNTLKQGKVFKRLESHGVDVVYLMETRIRSINISMWVAILSDEWNYLANYDFVDGGRIWVLWKKRISVSVVGGSDQALSILGEAVGHSVMIIVVYCINNNLARRGLWDYLRSLESVVGNYPWVIGGDFNVVDVAHESYDYPIMGSHSLPDIEELQGCMEDLELQDHPFVGPLFTWSNKQDGSYLARKLDRILVNPQWMHEFPISFAEYKAPGVSDHCLGLIWTQKEAKIHKPKPFKIFNCWATNENFLSSVKASWVEFSDGNAMQVLNRTHFSDISARVKAKRAELEQIQLSNLTDVNHVGMEVEKRVQSELVDLEIAELDIYRKRDKVYWLEKAPSEY